MTSIWDASKPVLKLKGKEVVIHGFDLTTLEYLLKGIGMKSFCTYDWNDKSKIITTVNTSEIDAIMSYLNQSRSGGVIPAVRLALDACYVLNVVTPNWESNDKKYPDLSGQYNKLVDELVHTFTSQGVVVILDLHWNDDVTDQQPMALKALPNAKDKTGDSKAFWEYMANKYKNNDYVFYELYNEPNSIDYNTWLNGNNTPNQTGNAYWGMKELYETIRTYTENPILIGGTNWAYSTYDESAKAFNDIYFNQFVKDVNPTNILAVLHPYQGKSQGVGKIPSNFATLVQDIQSNAKTPVIATEMGQYCCKCSESSGHKDCKCGNYSGTYNGKEMSYMQAILEACQANNVSWTLWAWRPNSGAECNQPDVNNELELTGVTPQGGADYATLFPEYYPVGIKSNS